MNIHKKSQINVFFLKIILLLSEWAIANLLKKYSGFRAVEDLSKGLGEKKEFAAHLRGILKAQLLLNTHNLEDYYFLNRNILMKRI